MFIKSHPFLNSIQPAKMWLGICGVYLNSSIVDTPQTNASVRRDSVIRGISMYIIHEGEVLFLSIAYSRKTI